MKKKVKKMELSRETLHALGQAQIQEAVGASGGGVGELSHCITECCIRQPFETYRC
jgi:hypothetical protein